MKRGFVSLIFLTACTGQIPDVPAEPEPPDAPLQTETPIQKPDMPRPPNRSHHSPHADSESISPSTPVQSVPQLADRFPGVTLRAVVQFPQQAIDVHENLTCTVEDVPNGKAPEQPTLFISSQDGKNRIYGASDFRGGDHNVFEEVDGVFGPEAKSATVLTPDMRYDIQSNSPFGFSVHYSNKGELSCSAISGMNGLRPQDIGRLRHYVHDVDIGTTSPIFIRGRRRGDCLTVLDRDSVEYVAVFPTPLAPALTYSALRRGQSHDVPFTEFAWHNPHITSVQGVLVALDEPLPICGNLSYAVLFRDTPVWNFWGVEFPATE